MGFLQICSGVVLLQLSKSAKDVPDAAVFKGDLDQVRTVAEQEEPESEPKADAIRGTAAIIRRFSNSRQMKEAAEAKRVHEERLKDQMEPIGENEQVEWDGLRRRKTLRSDTGQGLERRKTLHPPLGLTRFPDSDDDTQDVRPKPTGQDDHEEFNGGFMDSFRRHAVRTFSRGAGSSRTRHPTSSMAMTDVPLPIYESEASFGRSHSTTQKDATTETAHVFGLPQGLHRLGGDGNMDPSRLTPEPLSGRIQQRSEDFDAGSSRPISRVGPSPPPHTTKRQFSFQNVFHRRKSDDTRSESRHGVRPPSARSGLGSRSGVIRAGSSKSVTEEERLGLVKGDSNAMLPLPDYTSEEETSPVGQRGRYGHEDEKDEDEDEEQEQVLAGEKEIEQDMERQKWIDSGISPERYKTPLSRQNLGGSRLLAKEEEPPPLPPLPSGRESKEREGSGGGGGGAFI